MFQLGNYAAGPINLLVDYKELVGLEELEEYFRLRAQVYRESGYLSEGASLDIDAHDPHSRFVGAFVDEGKLLVGGARMILPPGDAPNQALVAELAQRHGLELPTSTHHYCSESGFELASLRDYALRESLKLVEFGRTVCHPDYRGSHLGMGLAHAIHGLALRHGIELGLASAPPYLRSFYEQFGCFHVERSGKARVDGIDTELVPMILDLRRPDSHRRFAHIASEQMKSEGGMRLCADKYCLLLHDHSEPRAILGAHIELEPTDDLDTVASLIDLTDRDEYDWEPPMERLSLLRKVELHDETLRDGLQSPSVTTPRLKDKIELLHSMCDLGLASANLGLPGAGERFEREALAMVNEIKKCQLPMKPALAGRTLAADIEPMIRIAEATGVALEAGLFLGSSTVRMVCENWSLSRLVKLTREAVGLATRFGLEVMFVTEDTTRAHPHVLKELFQVAIEAGARRLCLCDTVGHATPTGVTNLVAFAKNLLKQLKVDVKLDWHGHRDRGLSVVNTVAALRAGIDRVHATALGIGERVGNTPLERLVSRLSHLQGEPLIDSQKLLAHCRLVARYCEVPLPFDLRTLERRPLHA